MAMNFAQTAPGAWTLDVKGQTCPQPQIFTLRALKKLDPGDCLTVVFDNPSSGETIGALCDAEGHDVLERIESGGDFTWTIRKG